MGKRNQIYAKYVRILQSADNPNEIFLVLSKDQPMERKHIRQFDNMFAGKDVILTINLLIRAKNTEEVSEENPKEANEAKKAKKEEDSESPFWSVET